MSAPVASIDTPEFRELVGKVYKRTSYSFLTANAETESLIGHIDAHTAAAVAQAKREGWDSCALANQDLIRQLREQVAAMPEGWRLVEKKTHYQLNDGNTVVASLAGPDAETNAAIIARSLAAPQQHAHAALSDEDLSPTRFDDVRDQADHDAIFRVGAYATRQPAPIAIAPAVGYMNSAFLKERSSEFDQNGTVIFPCAVGECTTPVYLAAPVAAAVQGEAAQPDYFYASDLSPEIVVVQLHSAIAWKDRHGDARYQQGRAAGIEEASEACKLQQEKARNYNAGKYIEDKTSADDMADDCIAAIRALNK